MADDVSQNPRAAEIVQRMFPVAGARRLRQLEQIDPDIRRVLEDFVYGGMYAREVLDQRTRELCAVAALTVLGRNTQLRTHILASLHAGASRKEIQEVIFQMAVYAGFPAMLGGLEVAQQVWNELDQPGAAGGQ